MAVVAEEIPVFFPELREKALIFIGDTECNARTSGYFKEMGLPEGLLPLKDILESGLVEETGFSWNACRNKQKHHFVKPDRHCSYDQIITCTISKGRMSNIRGVKAKELGVWVPLNEIYVDHSDPSEKKVVFKSFLGLSRSMPFHLFE